VAIDTHAVGIAGVCLGAGRDRTDDVVDPAVGFVFARNVGDRVKASETIAWVHAHDEASAARAIERLTRAVSVGDGAVEEVPLVLERVG
jgi:thymidine phosphorylase